MYTAKKVLQDIADNNELHDCTADDSQNILCQRQLFLVTDEHRDNHQQHR